MTGIISYAQNFEDVILWRALGHIPNGTYLDVGAHHPDIDSVSRAFYDRGWRGVHVEPGPEVAQLLRDKRPGDMVVQAMVSDEAGVRTFYETPGGGLSTADRDIAEFHREQYGVPVSVTSVVSVTLDDVLDQVPGNEIHWLKIDVEGFERQVLLSWRTSPRRPWIVVVEATYPKTQTPTHATWEDLVLAKGYEFAYDDGLNRFYLSEDHHDLRERLIHPPNVFDEFQVNPSGASIFSQDMKVFMEGEISARNLRIEALERDLAKAHRDRDRQKALHTQLEAQWKDTSTRADQLVERLLERESDIADMNRRLRELAAGQRTMAWDVERLTAHATARRFLPWPLRALPGAWGRHATPLGRVLALPDGDFLRAAYRIVLGREPDDAGTIHHGMKLAKGRSRSRVLADLMQSQEALQRTNGTDLADLSDDEFVDAAYLRWLGRPADPEGRQNYIAHLGAGMTREQLMHELRISVEGRKRHAGLWHEVEGLVHRSGSPLGWRTWFAPMPVPSAHGRDGGDIAEIIADEYDADGEGLRPDGAYPTQDETVRADLQHVQDKINLLAAAVEGLGDRR